MQPVLQRQRKHVKKKIKIEKSRNSNVASKNPGRKSRQVEEKEFLAKDSLLFFLSSNAASSARCGRETVAKPASCAAGSPWSQGGSRVGHRRYGGLGSSLGVLKNIVVAEVAVAGGDGAILGLGLLGHLRHVELSLDRQAFPRVHALRQLWLAALADEAQRALEHGSGRLGPGALGLVAVDGIRLGRGEGVDLEEVGALLLESAARQHAAGAGRVQDGARDGGRDGQAAGKARLGTRALKAAETLRSGLDGAGRGGPRGQVDNIGLAGEDDGHHTGSILVASASLRRRRRALAVGLLVVRVQVKVGEVVGGGGCILLGGEVDVVGGGLRKGRRLVNGGGHLVRQDHDPRSSKRALGRQSRCSFADGGAANTGLRGDHFVFGFFFVVTRVGAVVVVVVVG